MQKMGLSLFLIKFPSPAGRFLLLTTKVGNRTLLSKIYTIFFLDAANLEFFDDAKLQLFFQPTMDIFPIVRPTVHPFQNSSDKPSNCLL